MFWLWLRIVLSALVGRMVLRSPVSTLVRLLRLRLWTTRAVGIEPLPLGRPTVRIGLIGHRKLDDAQKQRVQRGFAEALAACGVTGYGLRVVSGMAAGADRIAIDWALRNDEAELLAILPSEAQAFRDRSWVADAPAFDQQLAGIQSKPNATLLQLPGSMPRDREQQPEDPRNGPARIAAHRHKISVLLRQCEFLIAAMDLSDPGKPGGTRECVEEALALGTPVLVLDISNGKLALISRVDQLRPGGLPDGESTNLAAFVRTLVSQLPELDVQGHPKDLGTLARVYGTAQPSPLSRFSVWWTYFETWFAQTGGPRSTPVIRLRAIPGLLWNGMKARFTRAAPPSASPPQAPPNLAQVRRRIADDQRSLMAAYRGSFVLAYLLGLLAVTLALSIMFVFWFSDGQAKGWMLLLATVKVIAVWTITRIIKRSEHDRLSETAVALRYISERLRIMPTLAKLGSARLDLLHQTQRMGEPAKVAEDLCRRVTLAQIASVFDSSRKASIALTSLQEVQREQHSYNDKSHQRSHLLHHRLEGLVRLASKAVHGSSWPTSRC